VWVPLKNSQEKNRQGKEAGSQTRWRAFRGREKTIKGEEGLAEGERLKEPTDRAWLRDESGQRPLEIEIYKYL
jgi:hypothetical protein